MALDPLLQRRIMGHFATGVAVVTTLFDGRPWGMTANSLLSLSLDPPLILIAIDKRSSMHVCLMIGQCFAVNILAGDQERISRRFATRGPKDFSDIAVTTAASGAPIMEDALAYVDCRIVETLPGGDHDIFIGEPLAGAVREGRPLVFYTGQYTQLNLPPPPQSGAVYTLEDTYEHYGTF